MAKFGTGWVADMNNIHTPFSVVARMLTEHQQTGRVLNPSVCTKIPFMGYEISIAMDSSICFGNDLSRADIRVYKDDVEVTEQFLWEGENMLYGDGDTLFRIMATISGMEN